MKPKYPHTQPFAQLPAEIPVYVLENALLPGGELPLTASSPEEIALFLNALKSGQLIGMVQPKANSSDSDVCRDIYPVGCAGRIRQYQERKDGNINIMLTGVCRYQVVRELPVTDGYRRVVADWRAYSRDYETFDIDARKIDDFMAGLRQYFNRHQMQVDWDALNKAHIEEVVNNLVLVMNFDVAEKQALLEAPGLDDRIELFMTLLEDKQAPIWVGNLDTGQRVN